MGLRDTLRYGYDRLRLGMHTDQAAYTPADIARIASEGRWYCTPHLSLLNREIVHIGAERANGRGSRVIVTTAPRHGKSEFISKYVPAWWVGMFPDDRVMLASYEADFAATWGRKAQDVFAQVGPPIFGYGVDPNAMAASAWNVAGHAGGMNTAGVGGSLTGRGTQLLLIDDPVKNAEEAASEVRRNSTWEWFQSTAYTRLEPGGSVILIMTRWHEDDLAGRIIAHAEETGEPWKLIRIPALSDTNEVYAEITHYGRAA